MLGVLIGGELAVFSATGNTSKAGLMCKHLARKSALFARVSSLVLRGGNMIICPARILLNTFHFFRSAKEQFLLFPGSSALGHFVPKLRPGASAPGRSRWGPRAIPAKRVAWGEAEQGSMCSFRRKVKTEHSGLCLPSPLLRRQTSKAFAEESEKTPSRTRGTPFGVPLFILRRQPNEVVAEERLELWSD